MSHTPGPWRHDAQNHQIRTGVPEESRRFTGELIASVSPLCPEMIANARLIAAAPELLEALKDAQEVLVDPRRRNTIYANDPLWARMAEAIAKATGGAR